MQEVVHAHSIDLAIIDINIKGALHGIDVARYLKSKKIEFLFLTAYKDYDTIEDATDLAPLAYLTKPISQEELTASFLIAKKKVISTIKPLHDCVINDFG
jgi:two-component SAPR family response regulator